MEVGASLSHDMRGIREKLHLGALVDTKQRVAGLRVNPSRAGGPEMPSPAYLSLEQRAPLPSWPLRVPPPFAPRKPPLYLTHSVQPPCLCACMGKVLLSSAAHLSRLSSNNSYLRLPALTIKDK